MTIDRALIIMTEPLTRILEGKKVWEIRSRATTVRGPIGLIEKGQKRIMGTCSITDCVGPMSRKQFLATAPAKIGRPLAELEESTRGDDGPYFAWVLSNVKRLPKPIPFVNPKGAVSWVKLPPEIAHKIA